jgi:hypothetical protein
MISPTQDPDRDDHDVDPFMSSKKSKVKRVIRKRRRAVDTEQETPHHN